MDFKFLFIGNLIWRNILESHCDTSGQVVTEGSVEIWQAVELSETSALLYLCHLTGASDMEPTDWSVYNSSENLTNSTVHSLSIV
jgi:hypothetical protein